MKLTFTMKKQKINILESERAVLLEALRNYLGAIHPVTNEFIEYLSEHCFPVKVMKGKYLVKPSSEKKEYFFILKGAIRSFIKTDGKEITTWINEENEIVGSIHSLGINIPIKEYIQALENTELIGLDYKHIEYCYQHFPESNIIGRIFLEESYRSSEERAYIARVPSAEKRYNYFVANSPQLLLRIPLTYIASYLGMTLETLSRIRSKKKK